MGAGGTGGRAILLSAAAGAALLLAALPTFPPRVFGSEEESREGPAEAAAEILARECYACHNPIRSEGGLALQTHEALLRGGTSGPAIVPGDGDASRMIQMVEGFLEPIMPEDGFLLDEEIETLRRWVDAGAPAWRGDLARIQLRRVPEIPPRVEVADEIASLAFHPEGKLLAVGGFDGVRIVETDSREAIFRLDGPAETVRALAFSGDGRLLAAGGGMPTRFGEIRIWELQDRRLIHALEGHADAVYSVAFSPDGSLLATSGYDHGIRIWEVESGRPLLEVRGHVDAVFGVAFLPDGRLVSASADRTVRIWDPRSGRQLHRPFSEATEELYALAVDPAGRRVAAAGADRMIRIWRLHEERGELEASTFAHESAVLGLAFTPDGGTLISSGADRRVKLWDVSRLEETGLLEEQPDWVLSLAVSPDGSLMALGRFDGALVFYEVSDDGATPRRMAERTR